MADLRAKNKLMMLAYGGAKDSYAGNSEVLAVRQQVASLNGNQLPEDAAKATKDINVKLATFGGVVPAKGGGGGGRVNTLLRVGGLGLCRAKIPSAFEINRIARAVHGPVPIRLTVQLKAEILSPSFIGRLL
jgi:hypothetical protein